MMTITTTPNERKLLSVVEAAAALSLSQRYVAMLVRAGRIRSVRVGRRRLIPVGEIERIAREGLR